MSVFVFAGAAQFMAANMILIGTGAVEIIVATFVLNFRHFVMSFSFMNGLRERSLKWKIPLSLGLTDETFTVSSLNKKEAQKEHGMWFYAALIVTSYASWIGGSFLGGILGDVVPRTLSQSMGVALYAMFIGLLVPSVRKEWRVGVIALISILLNVIFGQFLSQGWAIVLATILGGLSGVFVLSEEDKG